MNGAEVDAWRVVAFSDVGGVLSEVPVERRQAPATGMIGAQIAQETRSALHTLNEFFRKLAHFVVGQTGSPQPLDREGDIGRNVTALQFAVVGFRREGQNAQQRRHGRWTFKRNQKKTSVV